MGRFLDSVLKRPSRSYAAEASYPWDPSSRPLQSGSDLGVGSSRRRTASLFSNDSEPAHHHYALEPAQPRHSFAAARRRGPSPVPEEPRRNSFSARPSNGALFDGDLPPLPPIPMEHQQHVRPRPAGSQRPPPAEDAERAERRERTLEHGAHSEHGHMSQRRDSRSRRLESGPSRPKQQFPQSAATSLPPASSSRPKDARQRLHSGTTSPPQPRSPQLAPQRHRSTSASRPLPLPASQSPPVHARPSDRRPIPPLTLAIAPPSTLSRVPPSPLLSPASHALEREARSGPTSPRVVSFADVVQYSEAPAAFSDEESEYSRQSGHRRYSIESSSSDDRSTTAPTTQPNTPRARPKTQPKGDDVPPVPPRSPKRGTPGARRDSIDSPTSPVAARFSAAPHDAHPAPLVPAHTQTFHMSMEHSTGSNADRRPVHDARHVEEAPRLSRPVRPQEHPPPEARPHSQAPPQQTESSQLIGRRNPLTAPMISSAALSSPKSTPENDASSTSSAADTVLASPLSPTAAVGAVSVPILDEAPSKRSSLVLDDAASEKSVYYTPRNSFYFNGNGSGATLNFSAVGEKFDVAADPEEPFEMPGAWSWEDETAGERAPLAKVARELTLQRLVGGPEGAPRSMPSPAPSAVAPAVALVEAAPVLAPTAPEKSVSPPLSSAPTSREALDGSVGHIGSDDGSYETAEGFSPGQSADPVNGVPQGVTPSDGTEEVETPQVQFTELPTFHLQPPTPATVTDGVMDSPFHDLDSPPLEREFDMSQEREAYEQEGSAPVPRSPATSASSFLDDELDLDSFAPDEIAYYTPDGPVVAEAQPRPSAAAAPSRPARTTAAPADDTPKWYEPHEKSKPRSRTTSLVRRSTSGSGVDAPSTPPKSKRDRGGRVSGAYVQVINRPTTPGVVTPEKPAKTRAAAMVDNYTSSLQRSGSKRSVRSSKSTRSERSGTVPPQRTIVPDKPEKRAATPRMKSPQPPRVAATQPLQPKPRRAPASASSSRPMSPIVAPPAQPEYGAPRGLSYTPDEPQLLSPPESLGRSSLSSESRRPSLRHNDWHDVQQAAPRPGSGNSSEVSGPSLASGPGPLNRAVIGQGGWAAAAAEPIKMFVPTDGDGWAAFQPLPPRSRATPLPGSRNSSFDLGGRSSSSAASSSLAQSASGSVAGAPQGSQVISPPLSAVGNMTSPTSSVSGRPPKSRLRTMYHASEHYESDEGEIPSRSYASPPPDHPGSTEQQRTACADDRGPPTVHVGGKDHAEHYDYASEHSNSQTSPAKTNGRWPADAFYDRSERGKAPSRPPSSRSSQYSAPSMYSAASAPPGRLNSPLPPLPADASPYEAAARAHAARLGLASSLNPNVLTVLPEMSIQDSNELYLPQRRNSHRFGSSASELGARGNMSPKRSASMFNVKRYSRAASDIGHGPREYASSEFARPGFADDIERRHSFDPRRGSVDSRSEARAPSRSQSFRAPSRTGDYNPGDVVAPSHGTGVISLDSPSVRPLNNYPLMESNGYDQTQQNGYTNMVLPKGGSFKPSDPMKAKGPDLQLLGVPPTSMAAITLSSALHTYHLKHESPTPAHLRWTLPPPVDFSTVAPPQHVSNTQILIQVYAVAVDWLDIAALDEKHKHDVGRWIPGRSFVGRCITTGVDEKEIARGDVVIGLLDIRHSGALAEYIVVGRRRVARVNPDTHLELEELAALPAQGIAVHRAIRDVGVSRGQQALVMDAHEGLPALFCQELTRMGLVVTAIVPGGREGAQAAALAYGARGVLAGSPTSVMHGLPESLFALVIDTAGAADAARRILCDRGHVLSLRSGDGPTPKHSLKSKLGLARKKNLSTAYVQPAGAGDAPVDASGLDYRDVLEEPVLGVLHPVVNEVVPFEQGASVFASRRNMDRLRVAVVRIVN